MRKIPATLAVAFLLAACGGGGSGSSAIGELEAGAKNGKGNCPTCSPAPAPAPSPAPAPAPAPAPTPAPAPAPAPATGTAPLGVNVEGVADWTRLPMFVDLMKASRKWGTLSAPWDEQAATDAQGWPTGDAGVVLKTDTVDPGDADVGYQYLPAGTYRLAFTGRAAVAAVASPNVSVASLAYDAATNRSTGDVVVGTQAFQLILTFTGTTGGVKDVSLRRPGYADTETFTSEFKEALAPFGTVRFMDFLGTNLSKVQTWGERITPASATQATSKGAAIEYAVAVANELGKDIWINVPTHADDAYVRSLAQLLKASLAPGRVVYVEYSNELWNFVFSNTAENMRAAVAEAIAGDTTLTNGSVCTQALFDAEIGDCNQYWAGFQRIGKRIARISQIFAEVYGPEAMNTTVRPVFATQFANPTIAEQVLKNMARYRGEPKTLIYGVATAPYLYLAHDLVGSSALTVDQIIASVQASLDHYAPSFRPGSYTGGNFTQATHKAMADYYGIRSLAYEGGIDLGQSDASGAAKLQSNRDARMGGIVTQELQQWYGCGNDLFMFFTLTSRWDRWGYWGLTNNPRDLATTKYVAAKAVAQTPRADLTTCR